MSPLERAARTTGGGEPTGVECGADSGATLLTPNRSEFRAVAGSRVRANEVLHEPTQTREVFDVSGAGDTVIATLAVMLASGADLPDAMRIANRAAGIVGGKLGTAVVSREEIVRDISEGRREKGEG